MAHPRRRILVIEDESAIADTVTYALETEGFEAVWRDTGEGGLREHEASRPDLVILDIGLPDANGFELYRRLQRQRSVPVIMLTARSDEVDRVAGLEMGADDYVVKPFSPRELTARVRAVLRRQATEPPAAASATFEVDEERAIIRYFGQELELSRYEYRLLRALLQTPERVYSREQLLRIAWDHPEHSLDRTVDTHIKTLRAKPALAFGVLETATMGVLVASSGSSQRRPAGRVCARFTAIDIAPIAVTADRYLVVTADTVVEASSVLHRPLQPMRTGTKGKMDT